MTRGSSYSRSNRSLPGLALIVAMPAGAWAGDPLIASSIRAERLPLIVEAMIPPGDIKGRIDHLAFDPTRELVYVAELGNDSVGIVDLKARRPEPRSVVESEGELPRQVTFVCEHGNAKSLMAASYFNRVAEQRGLALRAVARGTAVNSDTVPDSIVAALRTEGFEVSAFHPLALSAADIASSNNVVTIGLESGALSKRGAHFIEQWNDVPPASTDFAASFASIKAHVDALVEQLLRTEGRQTGD